MDLASITRDVRQAVRELAAAPLFSATAVLTLGLGIGAATALFSVVNATLLRPLPYPAPGDLIDVRTRLTDGRATTGWLSVAEAKALERASLVVASATSLEGRSIDASLVRRDGTAVPIAVRGVAAGFFETLGLPMALGRAFTADEHTAPGPHGDALVISHRLWMTAFAGAPDVIGTPARIAELTGLSTIVGVAAPGVDYPRGTDAWVNIRLPEQPSSAHGLSVLVRLQPDAGMPELVTAGRMAMREVARTDPASEGREFVFDSLLGVTVGDLGPTLLIALGATMLLLLLASINVANLTVARGVSRTHDVALRSALGASRARIVGHLVTESMLVSVIGAAAGAAVAWLVVQAFAAAGGAELPRLAAIPLDWRVAAFVIGATAISGLASGLAPAVRLARTDVRTLLDNGVGRHSGGRATSRLMSGLVVAEVALALALVAGGAWLVRSYDTLRSVDPGFSTDDRLVVDVRASRRAGTVEEAEAWLDEVLRRVRDAAPDGTVGAAWNYPFRADRGSTTTVQVDEHAAALDRPGSTRLQIISRDYVEAMGIRVVSGRTFTADDRRHTTAVVLVNRTFVRQFLGERTPLQTRIAFGFPKADWAHAATIVGVVDDVRSEAPGVAPKPTVYAPNTQRGYPTLQQTIVVWTPRGDMTALTERIRDTLLSFDRGLVMRVTPAKDIVTAATRSERLGMALMAAFGTVALVLAAVGVYGVIAYIGSTRRMEMATRLALGAPRAEVLRLMLTTARRVSLAGTALGVGLAYAGGRVLAGRVFGVSAVDGVVLGGSALLVLTVVFIATLVPAVRMSRADPIRALRAE